MFIPAEMAVLKELFMSAAIPAQQMSFGEFVQAAKATQLLNHGRNWEIFLHSCSLGFADGSLEAAMAQAHEREVRQCVHANSPDAPEWMKADIPSVAVLAEYPQWQRDFPMSSPWLAASRPPTHGMCRSTTSSSTPISSSAFPRWMHRCAIWLSVPPAMPGNM